MSIDPRLKERRKTVAEENAKKNVGRLLKFLLLVVVVGAGVWLVFSPWLSVSQVKTSGIEASDSFSVLAETRVMAGTPMISISASEVEAVLLEDPWVAEATVRLDWPNAVVVDIEERVPVAWVRTETGWARRGLDGVAVPSNDEPDAELARIDMPDLTEAVALSSADLLGALEFAQALAADLHPDTVITRVDDELWASVSGYQVRLGRPADMAEKALSLDALLGEDIPEGSTLVLIAPTNPAVMAPSAENEDGNEGDRGEAEDTGDSDEDS